MTEPEKLKNTLSTIFKRKGRDGRFTRLFENLESVQKDVLLKEVQLNEGELPVIGSAESQEKWLLVTTSRIVWRLGGKAKTLPVEAVRDVVADFQKLVATGRKKDQMKELQILATSGEQYTVEVEERAPLMGVWNALKNLGARNRPAK
jgi:hypothetical protein